MDKSSGEVFDIVTRNFEIEGDREADLEALKFLLAAKIRDMLERNVERLVSIMYRIDLDPKVVDNIFDNASKDEIAIRLAEAVIERQLQKAKTREIYRNSRNENEE
jgi:hypothetical protein